MLILHALNVTGGTGERTDGTADYDVEIRVNERVIWRGFVNNHLRREGAQWLLRRIADRMSLICDGCGGCLDCLRLERNGPR